MSIAKTYNPREVEDKWYQYWLENKFFSSTPDEREPYTIVIPPPNVTGVLHMGHMLNNTIQDVLIRRARMQGKNACWVPGTDHASIATEAKVVAMLKEKGIDKKEIGREKFLEYAWEWKEKYGGIILEQLKKLGASCDWDRTRFTMDADLSEAVIDTFIHLHNKGLVYRGVRMVNWDPQGKTAVSDEEVIYKEVNSKLYYVRYKVTGIPDLGVETKDSILNSQDYITVATTRPETILGDTGVCVHPEDERYKHLIGKKAIIPYVNREVPIIADEYIDPEFGTGCLKVTPAHDINDYNIGLKHNLEVIDTIADDGTMAPVAQFYVGMDRFACRKQIAIDLERDGFLVKVEEIKNKNGYSERTNAIIEPKLSMQWFVKMEAMAEPALNYVENGDVRLIPDKFKNTYRHWMENVKDWCISRQLWWGQQIPAWYDDKGNYVVAKTKEEALERFKIQNSKLSIEDIKQDEDVLDTWFSSWLWPMSVFDPSVCGKVGAKGNADVNYYYPTSDLVTAPEILFFWVARMIMAGHEFRGEAPFKNVYLTGIVRDKQGRKMSKSLGNSPDPIELIEKYGADGVRVGMLLSSPAGNDLLFDESYCEQGRNFANKIWNAFRLVKGWEVKTGTGNNQMAINWFDTRFNEAIIEIEELYKQYRLSEALMAIYKLVWDDFCAWYLEMIKPPYGEAIDSETYEASIQFFEKILALLHPIMPFITEELWHEIKPREAKDCIIIAKYPSTGIPNKNLLSEFETISELITQIRNIRNTKQISPKQGLPLAIKTTNDSLYVNYLSILKKLANIEDILFTQSAKDGALTFIVNADEFFVDLGENIDKAAELDRMTKELEYTIGFMKSVKAKLSNERFVANAKPEVVESERKKLADAETKIGMLKASIAALN